MRNTSVSRMAIVGTFQVGKSTLLNCLLSDDVADMGEGLPTTHVVAAYRHASDGKEDVHLYPVGADKPVKMNMGKYREAHRDGNPVFEDLAGVEFDLCRDCLKSIEVLDTPGLDAPGEHGRIDEARTLGVMGNVDFFLLVVPNRQLSQPEQALCRKIADTEKPCAVAMNCMKGNGGWPDSERNRKAGAEIAAQLSSAGLKPVCIEGKEPVWACNVLWALCAQLKIDGKIAEGTKLAQAWDDVEYELGKTKMDSAPAAVLEYSRVQPLQEFLCGPRLGKEIKVRVQQALKLGNRARVRVMRSGDTASMLPSISAYEAMGIQLLANDGDAESQYLYGLAQAEGLHIAPDTKEAAKWLLRAAKQGQVDSQLKLGICYLNGEFVEKDDYEAFKWLRAAAKQGNADAEYRLALCYLNGKGVEKDRAAAVKLLRQASGQSHEGASSLLCDDCGGDGTVECAECEGEGSVPCEECDGDGQVDCETCDENGEVACEDCGGDGLSLNPFALFKCSACSGSGTVICEECDSDCKVECEECEGEGERECEKCNADGETPCKTCKGAGLRLRKKQSKVRVKAARMRRK